MSPPRSPPRRKSGVRACESRCERLYAARDACDERTLCEGGFMPPVTVYIISCVRLASWSQTGDKHGAAHVHVGCTVGICGRTQLLQAWARMQLRRDWLRMGPRSYRRRHRCHHRRTATGRSPPPSPPPAGVASSARLLAGRAARCLAHRRGHHLGAALSPPLAANGVAVVCGCQMALRACAAAKWRCAVCGCRMALRGVRLPNVAAGV